MKDFIDRMIKAMVFLAPDGGDGGGSDGGGDSKGGASGDGNGDASKAAGSDSEDWKGRFQDAVKTRDEAKRKLREYEENEERRKLEAKGEYQKIADSLKGENEALKAQVAEAAVLRESLDKILRAEAEGLGDVAEAIITNSAMSFDARMGAVKTLKAKITAPGGTGTSAGSDAGGTNKKKALTEAEVAKLSSVERAKYFREQAEAK